MIAVPWTVVYDYGRLVYVHAVATHNVLFFLFTHMPGWRTKTLNAGRSVAD